MTTSRKYDVFLSYTLKNLGLARVVSDELARCGLRVWHSKKRIQSGRSWEKEFRKALESASSCVVLLSPEAISSPAVNFAIGAALSQEKKIIPVFLSREAERQAPALLTSRPGIVADNLSSRDIARKVAVEILRMGNLPDSVERKLIEFAAGEMAERRRSWQAFTRSRPAKTA